HADVAAQGEADTMARHRLARRIQEAMDGEFHSLGLVLGYEYADSPIVVPDDIEGPVPDRVLGVYTPSTRPRRSPAAPMAARRPVGVRHPGPGSHPVAVRGRLRPAHGGSAPARHPVDLG